MEHKKHKHHPHDKVSAMPQFNEPHWQKKVADVELADTKYGSEMNQCAEYKTMVDKQSAYAKKHKAEH
jgi:hypothetical protein